MTRLSNFLVKYSMFVRIKQNLYSFKTFLSARWTLVFIGFFSSCLLLSSLYHYYLQQQHHQKTSAQLARYADTFASNLNQEISLINYIASATEKLLLQPVSREQKAEQLLSTMASQHPLIKNLGITLIDSDLYLYPASLSLKRNSIKQLSSAVLNYQSSTPSDSQGLRPISFYSPQQPSKNSSELNVQRLIFNQGELIGLVFLTLDIEQMIEQSKFNDPYNGLIFEIKDHHLKSIYTNKLDSAPLVNEQLISLADHQWSIGVKAPYSEQNTLRCLRVFQLSLLSIFFLLLALFKIQNKYRGLFKTKITQSGKNNRYNSPSYLLPASITLAILFALGSFYLLLQDSERNTAYERLLRSSSILKSDIDKQLLLDRKYLTSLALKASQPKVNKQHLPTLFKRYSQQHNALSHIEWSANSNIIIRDKNVTITDTANLTTRISYSKPELNQDKESIIKLSIKIFDQRQALGTLTAAYKLKTLLKDHISSNQLEQYQLSVFNADHQPLSGFDYSPQLSEPSFQFSLNSMHRQFWVSTSLSQQYMNTHNTLIIFMLLIASSISLFFWWQYKIYRHHWKNNKALRSSFEHFQNIAKASPMAILITQKNSGKITFANDQAGKLFLYSPQNILGLEIIKLYWNPSDQAKNLSLINKQGFIESFELRVRRSNNTYFWAAISSKIIQHRDESLIISSIIDLSERKHQEHKLLKQANYDSLTGLANRSLALERLQLAITSAKRNNKSMALMMLDLDNFKYVNDNLGHNFGDLLLQDVALKLKKCFRKNDTVARLGGDEFTFILPNLADLSELNSIAQSVLDICEKPLFIQGQEIRISASIGISIYPKDGNSQQVLLKNADIAMYQCKENGRNQFSYYNQQMSEKNQARMLMEFHIRRALINCELRVYYQPLICIKTGKAMGAEALLRWHNPQLGQVPPDTFIPLAESIGLIDEIGDWVLETACQQIKDWRTLEHMPSYVAVNVSSHQFRQDRFIEHVASLLESFDLPAHALELEITETTLLDNTEVNCQKLKALHELGVKVSIDDFGTGYSSLSYLQKFEFDTLKIDRSFIKDITLDPKVEQIVNAILSMAKILDLVVIAEGVENAEQLALLTKLDCPIIQGYYLAKPSPACDIQAVANYH